MADYSRARQQLHEILASPEFSRRMRAASAWERWKQQLSKWLAHHFASLFDGIARHPTTSQLIFWTVVVGCFGFICFQLFRLFSGSEKALQQAAEPAAAFPHDTDWISAARVSARSGQLNRAIQCAYWAVVVHLQNAGALPKTGSRTPREFLAEFRSRYSLDDLRRVTSSLERFWYARVPAAPEDYAAVVKSAHSLGCKLD